ncbi:MAG: sel1 repeat family protein [Paludibacteraceae bacterium]|nr:sel1 repeat family protein [Paludibacteraceae bacterium]
MIDIEKLTKAAKQGDLNAQRRLADCYYDGVGVELNYDKAFEWYSKIMPSEDSEIIRRIGVYYYQKNDLNKAFLLWEKSADLGNAAAHRNLGNCYYNGYGVPQNYVIAIEHYTQAAEQGDPIAQYNLAESYSNGLGVTQNFEKAIEWYEKAAQLGLLEAQFNLGVMYMKGEGVIQNYKKAAEWYKLAADQGDEEAKKILKHLYKRRI